MSDHHPEEWTTRGLLDQICDIDNRMEDRAFAFIIGAGASVASGIDSGGKLVEKWLGELKQRLSHNDKQSLEEWATADNLGIEGFDYANAASFYPQVFERRFRGHQDEGFAYLEDVMEGKEPSIGYSVLAKVLADTRHRVVITTNFDNLVADALATYTQKHPLVAGHESLTSFVRTRLRRPLVAKIHRDLFLAPINDEDVGSLKDGWERALKKLFEHYTPIVIGYGGNDGSLMELLRELPEGSIPGGIYWCYRKGNKPTDERILEAVARQHGKLVPVIGFDEFMMELGQRFNYPTLAKELEQQGKERVKRYREQFEAIHKRINAEANEDDEDSIELKEAVNATAESEKDWWGWQLRINEASDDEVKERLYRQALEALPESHKLTGNFALFMEDVRREYDEAEKLFRKTLKLAPGDASHTGNFASFIWEIRKEHDEAEKLYRKALELEPNHANNTGNFALFMWRIRKEYDEAERLYRKALELDPNHANHTGNFASFMAEVRKEYDEAEQLNRNALRLDPSHTNHRTNYSALLIQKGSLAEAKIHALRACKTAHEPSQALAEGLLYLGLLALVDKQNDTPFICRLKGALVAGYERVTWNFTPIINAIADRIDKETLSFYRLISNAILDESALPALEKDERWQSLEAIPAETPWEE